MKQIPDNSKQIKRTSSWRLPVFAAGIIALIQACLTVEGMGIEGFVLWFMILFVGYWLLLMILRWLWQTFHRRS